MEAYLTTLTMPKYDFSGVMTFSFLLISRLTDLLFSPLQFDILWDALSGEEHLQLFATIKGLSPSSINSVCLLQACNWSFTAKRTHKHIHAHI